MIKSKSEARSLHRYKDTNREFPAISGNKRIQTAFERKDSRQGLTVRPQSTNRQMKRTLSTSNACKTVRYEATTALYNSKIKEIEKQNLLLENQIKKVKLENDKLRNSKMKTKRTQEFRHGQKQESNQNDQLNEETALRYRKNVNINDPKSLNNEIRIMENKIGATRKKIDQQFEKNKTARVKIDAVRKQITTYKRLNENLLSSSQKVNEEFERVMKIAKTLESEIAEKNCLVNKIKVESLHKKGQVIKQYDNILRHLDKELSVTQPKALQTESSRAFYMTEIGEPGYMIKKKNNDLRSPKKRQSIYNNQLSTVQQNLEYLESQFEYLKKQKGTNNVDQLTKSFLNQYQQNFEYYRYINDELTKNLEEAQLENQAIKARKDELLQEIHSKNSETKIEEISEIEASLDYTRSEKNRMTQTHQQYNCFYEKLKEVVKDIAFRINFKDKHMMFGCEENYEENNIGKLLHIIQERFYELKAIDEDEQGTHLYYQQLDLDSMLENIKKETVCDKLLDRQQLLKMRQTMISNGNTSISKKNKSSSRSNFPKK